MGVIVDTEWGSLQGGEEAGMVVFRGIPFAAPPVAERRFLAPQPLERWSGVRDATRFGGAAPQNPMMLSLLAGFDPGEQSEDCLYLNVTTPGLDAARRPVLVWIHGGAFTIGSGSQSVYDGAPLARRGDVVVVTINYRLGALGFLRCEEIGATGNAGLHDQIAALRWVRDCIDRFGGDPENVTIFGESAGGMSVGSLLGAPSARGLFHRAVPQSGAAHNVLTKRAADAVARDFLEDAEVAAAELRALSVVQILAAQQKTSLRSRAEALMPFQPVVDGELLPMSPIEAIRRGSAAGVSLLVGTTRDEWRLFGAMDPQLRELQESGLLKRLESSVPAVDAQVVVKTYRETWHQGREGASDPTPADLFFAIQSDRIFRIPAIRLAEAQLSHSRAVYKYLVTWESPAMDGALGACHAIELPFVFGTLGESGLEMLTGKGAAADALSEAMMDAWIRFARSGNPGHAGLPEWPAYDIDNRATMRFGAERGVALRPGDAARAVWEAVL